MPSPKNNQGSLPTPALAYVWAVIAVGAAALFLSLRQLLTPHDAASYGLILLTVFTSWFPLRVPVGRSQAVSLTSGEFFIFLAMALFDPEVAVCAAALEGLATCLRGGVKSPSKHLFNIAQNCTAVLVSCWAVAAIRGLGGGGEIPFFAASELLAGAFVYFVLNTGFVAAAVGLSGGGSIAATWKNYCFWAGPGILINAAAALVAVRAAMFPPSTPSLLFGLLAALFVGIGLVNSRKLFGSPAADRRGGPASSE